MRPYRSKTGTLIRCAIDGTAAARRVEYLGIHGGQGRHPREGCACSIA